MRFKEADGRKVVSADSAESIGRIEAYVIDTGARSVSAFRLAKAKGDATFVSWEDVQFGPDAVVVPSSDRIRTARDEAEARAASKDLQPVGKLVPRRVGHCARQGGGRGVRPRHRSDRQVRPRRPGDRLGRPAHRSRRLRSGRRGGTVGSSFGRESAFFGRERSGASGSDPQPGPRYRPAESSERARDQVKGRLLRPIARSFLQEQKRL
jgi:hypothetical protein